jgi:uroporphyrin-III C-methyltransferase
VAVKGHVSLVGAGPGDPGLLTRTAIARLRAADFVLYDALVDERILKYARRAQRFYVGKRAGRHAMTQTAIQALMVRAARRGRRIVRLKGGDPCVFGRGGEEALALADANIPFRIVPGITAGIGGLAYAGIPVTHRDIASAVTFVTGHERGGAVPESLDWDAIAKGSPVIVLYMALNHLARIMARLIEAGRKPDEPVAIISKATTQAQRVLVSSLEEAAASAQAAQIEAPTIIVVGEVVRLRATLDWLGAGEVQ